MRTAVLLLLAVMLSVAVAQASVVAPCDLRAKAFTAEAGFMSPAGNLRLQVYQNNGRWMTPLELEGCQIIQPLAEVVPTAGPESDSIMAGQLVPFTAATNYMSLEGYLRWLALRAT